jgi:hypothetical protein
MYIVIMYIQLIIKQFKFIKHFYAKPPNFTLFGPFVNKLFYNNNLI